MIFTPLPRDDVHAAWPWLSETLKPAVDRDEGNTLSDVYAALVNGPDLVIIASGEANGVLVLEITEELSCWVKYVAGQISGGPHERADLMRQAMGFIERTARDIGCVDVKVCGRDWSVVLTEYELMPEHPNGLRKVLKEPS